MRNPIVKIETYLIQTYGCQANTADSNTIAGILGALGLQETNDIYQTDLLIVNTCSVRQKSEDKVYGLGKILKKVKEETGRKPFVVLAGCMVGSVTGDRQRYELDELKKKTRFADAYVNPANLRQIPNILAENNLLDEWAIKKLNWDAITAKQKEQKHAFVNISYGCDNFCTYCVVPYARGEEISRSKEEIVKEVQNLVKRGFSEITLCGQNVNSWDLTKDEKFNIRTGSDQKLPFVQLLKEVHEIEGVEKIDFLSSNPFDFTQDLIETIKLPKISDYMHIAVQSGNNEVLKRMNRRHTIEDFYKLIEEIKEAKPNLDLGTDIIVGFPGETREQFMDTVTLFEKVPFNVAFISIYSVRKGTNAQKFFEDDVPLLEKKWRHDYLSKVWKAHKPKRKL